jgi:hypothetical protein
MLQKSQEMGQGIYAIFATDVCTKQLCIVQKYSTDQNPKGKDSAVKDFVLDCSQKMTDDDNESGDN